LPNEILWGHRFEQMQLYRSDNNKFEINFSAFHSTYEVDTLNYSARHLDQMKRKKKSDMKQIEDSLRVMENDRVNIYVTSPSVLDESSLRTPSVCQVTRCKTWLMLEDVRRESTASTATA